MLMELASFLPSLIPALWNIGILHKQAKLCKHLQQIVSKYLVGKKCQCRNPYHIFVAILEEWYLLHKFILALTDL